MTKDLIFTNLKEIILTIKPRLDTSKITLESTLIKDLGVDSLSMLLLSLAIENKFGFQFDNQAHFDNVREVVDYIASIVEN